MGRARKKPEYDSTTKIYEQIGAVAFFYGAAYDDRLQEDEDHVSLREVADQFEITILKARKMLITAGMYSTHLSRQVQQLSESGKKIPEIMSITGLSRASVHSYLPYSKVIYNMPERSVDADRKKLQRERNKVCKDYIDRLPYMSLEEQENGLWVVIEQLEGCIFHTARGLKFRYKIKGGEIFIDRKKDSITRTSVMIAFHNTIEMDGIVSGPKKLGIFGVSYVYPLFVRIGLIKS